MDGLLILTILIIFFTLAFDFINGFHDKENAIATSLTYEKNESVVVVEPSSALNNLTAFKLPYNSQPFRGHKEFSCNSEITCPKNVSYSYLSCC